MTLDNTKSQFYSAIHQLHQLDSIRALLDWDQQVMLPAAGEQARASQLEVLSVIRHQKLLDPNFFEVAQTLKSLAAQSSDDLINASWMVKTIEREKKLSDSFVAKRARLQAECFQVWQKAKEQSRFEVVKGTFARLLEVYREEANIVGYQEHQYDALLDQYEPEARVSWVLPLLQSLGNALVPLITERELNTDGTDEFPMKKEDQYRLGEQIVRLFGLPASSCRLDASSHPFCTTIGINDVRITTRYDESNLLSALSSTMHELGHALYEFHQDSLMRGTACGEIYSLGLHESQSRLVENCIGRSKEFCEFLSRTLHDSFGIQYAAERLYASANQVRRSLIRVDADEVTYSLHVLIRFELELELLSGSLTVDDLPERWNQKYQDLLGIYPEKESQGVLQDVHWYSGAFGYFPTYVLGNIYKGTMLKVMQDAVPDMWQQIRSGDFVPVVEWLKSTVHQKASRLAPRELVRTLQPDHNVTADDFLNYLRNKDLS